MGQPRVLIVEDQCDDAETLRQFLELVGYEFKKKEKKEKTKKEEPVEAAS